MGTSNDSVFVREDISVSASELICGGIAVLAGGGGTGRAVFWSANDQLLEPKHTNIVEAAEEVQAGHQELVAEDPSLV